LREYHFEWSPKAYVYAAIGGYNHVIKYLHKKNCPLDKEVEHILEGYGIKLYPNIEIGPAATGVTIADSGAVALGDNSVALGDNSVALGDNSVALGDNSSAVPVVDSSAVSVVDSVRVHTKSIDEFLRERLCGFDECYHFNQLHIDSN